MAREKKKEPLDSWEYYQSIQLTPEELRGKVHLDLDIDELREDRD